MKQKHVLMVADHVPYVKYVTSLGMKVTLFQSPNRSHLINTSISPDVHIFPLDDTDKALKLSRVLHEIDRFDGVFSFSEEGVELASMIANSLELLNNPVSAVQTLINKASLRALLNNNHISKVQFLETKDLQEAKSFIKKYEFPFILKPSNGSGSKGIYIANTEKEFEAAFNAVRNIDSRNLVLIEEYLDGLEFSVESLTIDGIHHLLCITDKLTLYPSFVEVGHTLPSRLDKQKQQEIFLLVNEVLDLIGHVIGPSHIEVKYTSKGPKIIEAHSRPGGDFIAYMVENALGIDMLTLSIKKFLGESVSVPDLSTDAAAVRYFQINPGKVVEIEGIDVIRAHPNVIWVDCSLQLGDDVPVITHSHSRVGCVVVKANSADKAAAIADELVNKLHVITE